MLDTPETQKPARISSLCHYIAASEGYGADTDPELVFIFGWTNAKMHHLLRYSAHYARMYPSAAQLLIQCDLTAMALGSTVTNVHRQRPILDKLSELGLFTTHSPRMLFHVFSSGGSAQLLWLAQAISHAHPHQPPFFRGNLVPTCIILDSAPSACRLDDFQRGFADTYTTGPSRLFATTAATLVYAATKLLTLFRIRPVLRVFVREGLSDPNFLPWIDAVTPRVYMYSDADEVARKGDVEAHIMEARRRGIVVRAEMFIGSGHVGHARRDAEKYWSAVAEAWKDAVNVRAKL